MGGKVRGVVEQKIGEYLVLLALDHFLNLGDMLFGHEVYGTPEPLAVAAGQVDEG